MGRKYLNLSFLNKLKCLFKTRQFLHGGIFKFVYLRDRLLYPVTTSQVICCFGASLNNNLPCCILHKFTWIRSGADVRRSDRWRWIKKSCNKSPQSLHVKQRPVLLHCAEASLVVSVCVWLHNQSTKLKVDYLR